MTGGARDWDGTAYAGLATLQDAMAARALAAVTLRGDERVVDVGCGDGRVTAALADRLPRGSVLGVDPSPRMLAVARTRVGARTNLAVVPGRAEQLAEAGVAAGSADLVVSFNALHWASDPAAALAQVARAVRPGGAVLLLQVCAGPGPGAGGRPSLEATAMAVAHGAWHAALGALAAPFWHPEPATPGALLTAAGLAVDPPVVTDESWDFGSRAAFTAWCAVGFGAWTDGLPAADRPRFVDDVVTAWGLATGSTQVFRFRQLRVTARRPG